MTKMVEAAINLILSMRETTIRLTNTDLATELFGKLQMDVTLLIPVKLCEEWIEKTVSRLVMVNRKQNATLQMCRRADRPILFSIRVMSVSTSMEPESFGKFLALTKYSHSPSLRS